MTTLKMRREPEAESETPVKRHIEHMRITPAENGGHTVRHEMKRKMTHGRNSGMGYEYQEPEEHVFGAGEDHKMMNHIGKHLGIKGSWGGGKAESEEDL